MVQRYFITLAYDGTDYHGWQIQPNGRSVQEELQKALSLLLSEPISIVGAGRTDAGVHARRMVAHFDHCGNGIDCTQLVYRLNRMLPRDIAVRSVEPVAQEMHARFSATQRTYRYYLHTYKEPFLRHYSWEVHYELDFTIMNEGASRLIGEKDFACFCKSGADVKTTICQVTKAYWKQPDDADGRWVFTISANRFLRNMVRAVVGTLMELGRYRISLEQFEQILDGGTRSDAGESVPGHALFLDEIEY